MKELRGIVLLLSRTDATKPHALNRANELVCLFGMLGQPCWARLRRIVGTVGDISAEEFRALVRGPGARSPPHEEVPAEVYPPRVRARLERVGFDNRTP